MVPPLKNKTNKTTPKTKVRWALSDADPSSRNGVAILKEWAKVNADVPAADRGTNHYPTGFYFTERGIESERARAR